MRLALLILTFMLVDWVSSVAQNPYSARGYWLEVNQPAYQKILTRKHQGDSLTVDEKAFLKDRDDYLANYFAHLSASEQAVYNASKDQWDQEARGPVPATQADFEFRGRDKLRNGVYGLYYGISLVSIANAKSPASVGVPLIMAGLWQLGPVVNPKKYKGIDLRTIRAGNTGRILGLGYGAALGLAVGYNTSNSNDWVLGLSSLGSIALGEIAFQAQKKKQLSAGQIELMRHYGFLGPGVSFLTTLAVSTTDNSQSAGASLVGGGVIGLIAGSRVGRKYDFTAGDVNAISSLTWIATGLGFGAIIESIDNSNSRGLLLIPAASMLAGTFIGQHEVKPARLTNSQGNTISLASGGAALVGLGLLTLGNVESPTAYLAVPSLIALVTHQAILHSFKMKNIQHNLNLGMVGHAMRYSMSVHPENYLLGKRTGSNYFSRESQMLVMPQIIRLTARF